MDGGIGFRRINAQALGPPVAEKDGSRAQGAGLDARFRMGRIIQDAAGTYLERNRPDSRRGQASGKSVLSQENARKRSSGRSFKLQHGGDVPVRVRNRVILPESQRGPGIGGNRLARAIQEAVHIGSVGIVERDAAGENPGLAVIAVRGLQMKVVSYRPDGIAGEILASEAAFSVHGIGTRPQRMVMRDLQPSAPLDDASGKRVVPLEADGVQGPLGSASLQNQGAGRAVGRVADAAAQHKRLVVGAVADQQPPGEMTMSARMSGDMAPAMKILAGASPWPSHVSTPR